MIDWQLAKQLWDEPPLKEKPMKRTYTKDFNEEPDKKEFEKPSEREHLFVVTDIFTYEDDMGAKLNLDNNTVSIKCEVVGGQEAGKTLLQRLNLDENWKGFFATRLFLKAIGEQYKGVGLEIDTDRWISRQFYATVIHNGKYANISEYNYDKKIEQVYQEPVKNPSGVTSPSEISWEN